VGNGTGVEVCEKIGFAGNNLADRRRNEMVGV